MTERYKVLGAVLALRKFTVAEVARFSGVKETTVRTVLGRESVYWETIDSEGAPKRGGQYKQYRLKDESIGKLRSEIEAMFERLGVAGAALGGESTARVPLGIYAAEDRMLHLFPQAKTLEEKYEILRLVDISLDGGRAEAEALRQNFNDASTRVHLESASCLRKLCGAELKAPAGEPLPLSALNEIRMLAQLGVQFCDLGEVRHASAIVKRVSPLLQRGGRWVNSLREGGFSRKISERPSATAQVRSGSLAHELRALTLSQQEALGGRKLRQRPKIDDVMQSVVLNAIQNVIQGVSPLRHKRKFADNELGYVRLQRQQKNLREATVEGYYPALETSTSERHHRTLKASKRVELTNLNNKQASPHELTKGKITLEAGGRIDKSTEAPPNILELTRDQTSTPYRLD